MNRARAEQLGRDLRERAGRIRANNSATADDVATLMETIAALTVDGDTDADEAQAAPAAPGDPDPAAP